MRALEESDFGVLWAAYLRGSFNLPKMDEKHFTDWIYAQSTRFLLYVIEDNHSGFKAGRGTVGIVSVTSNGWMVHPVVEFFAWANPRHILRGIVSGLQMFRHQSKAGVCVIMAHEKERRLLHRVTEYGVLYFRSTVPWGFSDGDMLIYSVASRKR